MKKLLITLMVAGLLTLGWATVYASPPQEANGTTSQVCAGTEFHQVGGNTFGSTNCVRTYLGTLDGTITSKVTFVLHCASFPCDGSWNLDSSGTFEGSVDGSDPGTAFYSAHATKGIFPDFKEKVTIVGIYGGLAGLHAKLVRVGEAGEIGVYDGTFHFD